eukprot:1191984-Prorocentrum_minimum.AAC.2
MLVFAETSEQEREGGWARGQCEEEAFEELHLASATVPSNAVGGANRVRSEPAVFRLRRGTRYTCTAQQRPAPRTQKTARREA